MVVYLVAILSIVLILHGTVDSTHHSNLVFSRQARQRPNALQNFEVMAPPDVPKGGKVCEMILLEHDFADYGHPARVKYTPPIECGPPGSWASVVFNLTATSKGTQYDRLAMLYLDDVEVWRTSTAEPVQNGIIWTVTRDMSRYRPLLAQSDTELVLVLNNIVDPKRNLTGVFEVTLSARFYEPTFDYPATSHLDKIVTIGNMTGSKLERQLKFPRNMATAFVELFASGNGQEEFWYGNVPDEYVKRIDPNRTDGVFGRGAFREVQLWIDGTLAGLVYPFPVIYTGGILVSWWRPIPAIGAFDAPSFMIDITPFVPILSDGKHHNFTINVQGQGMPNETINPDWIFSGSVGFTMDPSSAPTTGALESHDTHALVNTTALPNDSEGRILFRIDGSRHLDIRGTVVTGSGIHRSVRVEQSLHFINIQTWMVGSDYQSVQQLSKGSNRASHNGISIIRDDFSFPLNFTTTNSPASEKGTLYKGQISHGYTRTENHAFPGGWKTMIMTDQEADGEMSLNDKGRVTKAIGRTSQRYSFRNGRGESYEREIEVFNVTNIIRDQISGSLASVSPRINSLQDQYEDELFGTPCRTIHGHYLHDKEEEGYLFFQGPNPSQWYSV